MLLLKELKDSHPDKHGLKNSLEYWCPTTNSPTYVVYSKVI